MRLNSAIYEGNVIHIRVRPKKHRLLYKVFSMLLDIDELSSLDDRLKLFGYNCWAPLAFFDRDHGPLTDGTLRPWVENHMENAGLSPDGGPIRLLCYPRVFGFVFNPISIFFCYDRKNTLVAILYEVCNTYKERHTYVIPVNKSSGKTIRQNCSKKLYVSPFIDMNGEYHFRIIPPEKNIKTIIRHIDSDGPLLTASFVGEKKPFNEFVLAACLLRFPLLTFKIVAGIHFEALQLWLKGLKIFIHKPASQTVDSSTVSVNTTRH
ncbi:MAG: DUF1365 domain-containing protein [Pseudomonadota bacterium]|nr:DUF1365 domain-containing protein [Pseudomonadota bacterium]